jgi:hypothetical protein
MGGDIRKFKDHKKLIAMAGIDPAIYPSGKHDGHGGITKRGNRHLRRVIWLMTIRVIQFNDCFRNYYKKRTQDGLPFKKAVLATAHKLLRVIYAVLTKRISFSYAANSWSLTEVKRPIILKDIHPSNRKSMTITSIGTLIILGMNIFRHNALRIRRISGANLRREG